MENFDFRTIAGLKAWYDAQDYSTIKITSSEVLQWLDKSGYGNHQVGTAGTAPAYGASALNSLPGVTFASGKFTSAPDHTSLDFTQFTAFVVFQRNSDTASNQGIFGKQTVGGSTNREFMLYVNSTDGNALQTTTDGTSGTGTSPTAGTNTNGTPYILSAWYDGANDYVKTHNVVEVQSGAVASIHNGTGTLDMGRAFGASGVVTISEALFFTNNLSRNNKTVVERILAKKWNLPLLGG